MLLARRADRVRRWMSASPRAALFDELWQRRHEQQRERDVAFSQLERDRQTDRARRVQFLLNQTDIFQCVDDWRAWLTRSPTVGQSARVC